jgi:hypothetical protein
MKYMIMMFGEAAVMREQRSPEWIQRMFTFMDTLYGDLSQSGELVGAEGLVDGSQAKTVRFQSGLPVVTDGPFSETKESIIGFWIVDVAGEARALEIASRIVNVIEEAVEVRRVGEAPPPQE